MEPRKPIVAGQFYPGGRDECIGEVEQCLGQRTLPGKLPENIVAGIVPHAGWTFSGGVAAMVLNAIKKQNERIDTFVIFGAAHGFFGQTPAVYDTGDWLTPLGPIGIDEDLAEAILQTKTAVSDINAHRNEHSIEVQVPFIQHLFADARILPIVVPAVQEAVPLGEVLGEIINSQSDKKIVCLGSTDLTHYGPSYGFEPMGTGSQALQWAADVNDKQFIDLALKLDPEQMLANSTENGNACGAGAAAAAVSVAKTVGKTQGMLLAQTNSNQIMQMKMGMSSEDSVGYASMVF